MIKKETKLSGIRSPWAPGGISELQILKGQLRNPSPVSLHTGDSTIVTVFILFHIFVVANLTVNAC